jgi:hypothetical protein
MLGIWELLMQVLQHPYKYYNLYSNVINGGCAGTASVQVALTCTGIQSYNNPNNSVINVYPNPFSDNNTFTIQSTKQNETYSFELLVLGKQVKSLREINGKQFQISRNGLQNGIFTSIKFIALKVLLALGN